MGMGYGANMATTVSELFVAKMCPKEYRDFRSAIETEGDFDTFAQQNAREEIEEYPESKLALTELQQAFYKATTTEGRGLTLDVEYHDHEEGDRYDDVDGAYWCVGNVEERTPAGQRFADHIRTSFFVTFG